MIEKVSKKYSLFFIIIILGISVFFRLYQITTVPPGLFSDEAMNGVNALEALDTGEYKPFYIDNNGREGLYINLQALAISALGNEPWALRVVSAIFGILTVLGLYLLTKALFKKDSIALFASFFLSISFWHINFSRIAFRAIIAPFFLVWGLWIFWKIIERPSRETKRNCVLEIGALAVLAGFIFGLGIHSYIAYRIIPLILIPAFWLAIKPRKRASGVTPLKRARFGVIVILLFILGGLLAAYPLLNYFQQNPQDFLGRASQISVFSSKSPALEIGKNVVKTIGMFFVAGDFNWRHNIAGAPQLAWPVAILFLLGLIIGARQIFKKDSDSRPEYILLYLWLGVGLLPVIISAEGLPHALRSLLVAPVAMIFAAIGLLALINYINKWIRYQITLSPKFANQLRRISKELVILLFVLFISLTAQTYTQYFYKWAVSPYVATSFNKDQATLGTYLKYSSPDVKKYVIMNAGGASNIIPMETYIVMYLTDTRFAEKQKEKNLYYIFPQEIDKLAEIAKHEDRLQVFMLNIDNSLRQKVSKAIPETFTYENFGVLIQEKLPADDVEIIPNEEN